MTKLTDNVATLATVKADSAALTWFKGTLSGWHKQAGSKPTPEMLMVPLLLGKRAGVEALHIAMCLRPEGCTVAQFVLAGSCGPANNYRRQLVTSGWFSCVPVGKPYAFVMTFTTKGADKLAKAQVKAAEAATVTDKPKAAKAARKRVAKVAPAPVADAEVPAAEVPQVTETQHVDDGYL